MKALVFERNLPRYAASRVASALAGSGRGVSVGPLRLQDNAEEPSLPGSEWTRLTVRLGGICGSDLSTLDGRSSRYFEDIVSFPFVPGHEIVAEDAGGSRVVVEPVLSCAARGVDPPCTWCSAGDTGCCVSLDRGHLSPGLQIGFCRDTGGGWGREMVAHASQIHAVPEALTDEDAVMVEPTACGVHAALSCRVADGDTVAVIGAGTLGLTTLAALRRWTSPKTIVVGAKHPVQRIWATELGADVVVEPAELLRGVRRVTGTLALVPAVERSLPSTASGRPHRLAGGADVVVDCVGSADSLSESLTIVRPRGRVVMVGMPSSLRVDLAPLWQRELSLVGAYGYGRESPFPGDSSPEGPSSSGGVRTFDLALELAASLRLGRLVTAVYPLERHAEAVAHAAGAGPRGAVKVVFDPSRKG